MDAEAQIRYAFISSFALPSTAKADGFHASLGFGVKIGIWLYSSLP